MEERAHRHMQKLGILLRLRGWRRRGRIVLIQLAAVRSAPNSAGKTILREHIRRCIVDVVADGEQASADNMCAAIDKFL